MDSEGQRLPSNPSAMLSSLLGKRAKLHEELRNIEKQRVFRIFTSAMMPQVGKWVYASFRVLHQLHPDSRIFSIVDTLLRKVYEMETSYLQDPSQCGNVLKGFEGFLSASKSTALLKRSRKFQPEDRLFSLSSVTSPAAEELAGGRDDGRSDLGVGRSKGGIYANGQGKPKKGRPAPRDAKKNRAAEQDFDYEDDPDLTS